MPAATNLFKSDVTILRAVVDFGPNVEWNQVSASVKRAEKTYIRSIFGNYYTNLLTAIGEDNLTEADTALLDELRLAAANLAWWLYAPKHNVAISSTGFQQTHTDKSKPAFQWAVKDAINQFRDAGFEAIENTFEFLELNEETYSFNESSVRKAAKGLVLSSVAEFEEEVDIVNSRYLFQRMIPEMKRVQRDVVAPIVGEEAFATIIKKLQKDNEGSNDLTESEKAQLNIIRPLIAYFTTAEVLQNKSVLINQDGVLVHNSTSSGSVDGVQAAQMDRIDSLYHKWMSKAQAKMDALDELVNPEVDKTEEEISAINTFDPDSKIGGFF